MSFPPSAACKFLDLPPVNLRNLHLHLTKNPFVSRPPYLCGVTLILFPAFACAICLRREFGNSIKKAGARSFKLHAPALRISIIILFPAFTCAICSRLFRACVRSFHLALLRCVSFALASAKNSLLILAHSRLEIVLLLVSPEQPRDSAQNPARHLPRHFAGRGVNRRILHAPQQ